MQALSRIYLLVLTGLLILGGAARAADWTADANGDWSDGNNWDTGIAPNNAAEIAYLRNDITATRIVNVDGNYALDGLELGDAVDASHGFTLNGTGSLTVTDGSTGQRALAVLSGTVNTIQCEIISTAQYIDLKFDNANAVLNIEGGLTGRPAGSNYRKRNDSGGTVNIRSAGTNINSWEFWGGTTTGFGVDNSLGTAAGGGVSNIGQLSGTWMALDKDRTLNNTFSAIGGTFDGSNGYDLTFSGNGTIGNNSSLTTTGSGLLSFTGTVNFTTSSHQIRYGSTVRFTGNNTGATGSEIWVRDATATFIVGSDSPFGNSFLYQWANIRLQGEDGPRVFSSNIHMNTQDVIVIGTEDITLNGQLGSANSNADIIMNGSGVLTIAQDNSIATTFGSRGTLAFTGNAIVNSGTLKVTDANAIGANGTVIVNGGTFLVGSGVIFDNNVILNSGAVLGGDGTLDAGGAMTVGNNVAVSPGESIGTLTIDTANEAFIFGDGSSLIIETDGTASDRLVILGDLDLSSTSDALTVASARNYPGYDYAYTILTYTGSLTGMFDTVSLPTNWYLDYSVAGQILLIPEPASLAVLGLGLLAVMRRKR